MSMYAMIFGESQHADTLLALLGTKKSDFYRYRDCYLTDKRQIAVYTRGGGGNRACGCDDATPEERTVEFAGDRHSPGCVRPIQASNRKHPCYLFDEDDDFDSTYATFYFRLPDEADRGALADVMPELSREERWSDFLGALQKIKA